MIPPKLTRMLLLAALAVTLAACGTPAPPAAAPGTTPEASQAPEAPSAAAPQAQAQPQAPSPAPASQPQGYAAAPAAEPPPATAGRALDSAPAAPVPPEPAPEPVVMTVPTGTNVDVAFIDSVSSNESRPGDSFRVRVTQDVIENGVAVIPAGSVIVGTVTEAVPLSKKIGGRAKLAMDFQTVELTSGRSASIRAAFAEAGKSETKKDAATIGGATAGGALLGRMLNKKDKGKGTLLGAIVGAAAGTAIAAKTEGEEVVIPSGTEITLQLSEPAHVTVTP